MDVRPNREPNLGFDEPDTLVGCSGSPWCGFLSGLEDPMGFYAKRSKLIMIEENAYFLDFCRFFRLLWMDLHVAVRPNREPDAGFEEPDGHAGCLGGLGCGF